MEPKKIKQLLRAIFTIAAKAVFELRYWRTLRS